MAGPGGGGGSISWSAPTGALALGAAAAAGAAVAVAALAIVGAWVGAPAAAAGAGSRRAMPAAVGLEATPSNGDKTEDDTRLQEAILGLWFGGGDVESNYRHKWFCAPGSARQRAFDAEVFARFAPLLQTLDADAARAALWQRSPRGALALVVLFDQLARHIYRHLETTSSFSPSSFPLAKAATDARALAFAQAMEAQGWLGPGAGDQGERPQQQEGAWEGGGGGGGVSAAYHPSFPLAAPEFVFALMPWRHAPTVEGLRHVLARVDARLALEGQHGLLLQRFRKTTLRRLQELEDKARAAADDDILEHHPFTPAPDELAAQLPRHRVAQAVKEYLDAHVKGRDPPYPALAVSLSGGVDSMVIAWLLKHFAPAYGNPTIVALHIDYANRAESGQEADYVELWCGEWGIAFRKRVVGEVTRGVTARDEYEKVARDIRFGFYKEAIHAFGCPAILLGHHQGDVQENVLSNAMRGVGPLHLSGMGQTSVVNGVPIHRPLLPLAKDAIFDFAHRFGVPYFKDTTPTWSTRGKLRRQLMPLLMDVYGEGVAHNLARLAAESDELRSLVSAHILEPFWQSVTHAPLAAHVGCGGVFNHQQSPFFWREALRAVLHARGQGMLTDKGVALLIKRLGEMGGGAPRMEVWCQLRREYATLLYGEGPRLFLFGPGVIREWDQRPSAKAAEAALDGQLAAVTLTPLAAAGTAGGVAAPTRLGLWDVSTRLLASPQQAQEGEEEAEYEELTSLEVFCRGAFGYSVALRPCDGCGAPPVLRVVMQESAGRKKGYRGLGHFQTLPLKVKRSIPVLGPACPRCDAAAVEGVGGGDLGSKQQLQQGPGADARVVVVRVCYRFVGGETEGQQG